MASRRPLKQSASNTKNIKPKEVKVTCFKGNSSLTNLERAQLQSLMTDTSATTGDKLQEIESRRPVFSTGSLGFDCATGRRDPIYKNGGIPGGAIVELLGLTGAFKTGTFCQFIKSVQERGFIAVALFSEAPNLDRMAREGVNIEDLVILPCWEPGTLDEKEALAETRLKQLLQWAKHPKVQFIGIDSVKSLVSEMQVYKKGKSSKGEKDFSDREMAVRANLMEMFFNLLKICNKSHSMVVMTNHESTSITQEFIMDADVKLKTSAGRRKEFEALLRVQIASKGIYDTEEHEVFENKMQTGLKVYWRLIKNRYAGVTGIRRIHSYFDFETSKFNKENEIVRYMVYIGNRPEAKITLNRQGNWFYYHAKALCNSKVDKLPVPDKKHICKGKFSCNGQPAAEAFLRSRPKIACYLEQEVLDNTSTNGPQTLFKSRKNPEKRSTRLALGEDAFDEV